MNASPLHCTIKILTGHCAAMAIEQDRSVNNSVCLPVSQGGVTGHSSAAFRASIFADFSGKQFCFCLSVLNGDNPSIKETYFVL